LSQELGVFDGGRGASDSIFDVLVTKAGLYPLRVLWFEGGGGANIEIFSLVDGEKVLINDPDVEGAIKAFIPKGATVDESIPERDATTGRAAVVSITPASGEKRVEPTSSIEVVIENGSATSVDQSSVKMSVNGKDVAVDVSKSGDVVTIAHTPDGDLAGEVNTAIVSFKESNGTERSAEWSFEVKAAPDAKSLSAPDNGWIFSDQAGETAAPIFGDAAGILSGGVEWSTEDPLGGGGSVSFDGTDGTVIMEDLAEAFNDLSNFSLSMWIKANDTGIDKGFWEAVDSGGGDLWGLRYDSTGASAGGSNVIKLGITTSESGGNTNRGEDQQESHEGTQTTEWQHIVMTWEDGEGFNLYIDGVLDEPTLAMQNTVGTTALMDRFVLGDGAKAHWDGLIDEVAVWSSTLSAADAAWLAKNSIAGLAAGGGDGPALSIVNNGDGTVTVTFEGTLQSADSVNGPWSDVDAASPLTIPASEAAQFGRAKN
jgi:hypothetical protein